MLAVIVLIIFAVAFVIMGYILSYGGTKSCKGCIYNTEPVSYTHLDVYKRQGETTMIKIKNILCDVLDYAYPDSDKLGEYKRFYVEMINETRKGFQDVYKRQGTSV